jgi:signal transduction histidine kinase
LIINQKISKWAWKPFYNNLSKLEQYDITRKGPVQLEDSGILEVETLNKVISTLMQQVEKDFKNLKEFNENISHEIQTPLSIIRNKMVLLLESPNLEERERQSVEAAYQEVNKLSKIGKSLTLISRIENQEFRRLDDVDLRILVENISSNMAEIIDFKDLQVSAHLKPVTVKCDPILANILFTNLLKNAIQHNQEGGYIRMLLDEKKFEIENTGEVLTTETTKLFNRFQKGNTTTDSLGLGLAINQKICEIYGFQLDYEHQEGKHRFSLYFANDQ